LFPAWGAQVLALHPQVREAAVRPMRPDEGQRPKAFAVAQPGTDVGALRAAWTFGARLPRQASGKGADWIIDAQ
jgi:acyl-coenzyme A synthetase/AMP-(fatty) acid ligase